MEHVKRTPKEITEPMLKYHEIIRPTATESFFQQSVDLWLGLASGHMGPQLYQHHNGTRAGQPMSGVCTWDQHAKFGTIPAYNEKLFRSCLSEAAKHMENGLPIVEFGPGSMSDAKAIIKAVGSREYIPVDCTLEVIKNARLLSDEMPSCTITPSVIDFFSKKNCSLIDRPALGAFLGGTVANIPGSVPSGRPRGALISAFKNLTRALPAGGYLLVSVDTCENGGRNIAFYNEPWHRLFGINHLYRMAEELPMHHFDPDGFEYLPVWHKHCGLLAHTVVATKDQKFEMGDVEKVSVSVKRGDVFHYNNSFKYNPGFFEDCAEDAGLEVIDYWEGQGQVRLYLFHVPVIEARNSFNAPKVLSPYEVNAPSFRSGGRLAVLQESLRSAA